jgi:3-oxoadipate enol-lactonase
MIPPIARLRDPRPSVHHPQCSDSPGQLSPGLHGSDALRKITDLKDCADVLVEILDELGIGKCVLAGNCCGGMLAGVFPAYYPACTTAAMVITCTASLPTMFESLWATAPPEWLLQIMQEIDTPVRVSEPAARFPASADYPQSHR